jgi:DNA polymerase III subunit epsilon
MEDDEVLHSREFRYGYNSRLRYEPEAMKIHGITVEELYDAPGELAVYRDVKEWLELVEARDLPIVSHKALFDQGFWDSWHFRCGRRMDPDDSTSYRVAPQLLSGPWHCTVRLASRILPALPNYKLDTVAAHLGLMRSSDLHGALEDAVLAGHCFYGLQAIDMARRVA